MSKKVKKAYSTGKWHGKTNYQCGSCSWSTLDLGEMEKHVAKHVEAAKPKVVRKDTGLIGPGGGKIVKEEVVEPDAPAEEGSDG